MQEGLEIRAARASDLEAVLLLERATVEAPHWPATAYAEIVRAGEDELVQRCLMLAVIDGELGGFAVAKVLDANAELESLAVEVESRRLGVGTQLCRAVMQWCREQGAEGLDLEVRAGSAGAIRLYESLGFLKMGLRTEYYREPLEDAVTMRCGFEPSGWLW